MQIHGFKDGLAIWRQGGRGVPVLYVHGSTFPTALSVGYRFEGGSWADRLCDAGFDVWGFDFAGHGASRGRPWFEAETQIQVVVDYVVKATGYGQVLILAHSWGSLPAGRFTCRSTQVRGLALFGPIARREGKGYGAVEEDLLITVVDQYARFGSEVPAGEPAVLADFQRWAGDWLASDPEAAWRTPPAVRVPFQPYNELYTAWSGRAGYDPGALPCPVLVVRGEWDQVCGTADAAWFGAPVVTVPRGTHLLHLEHGRHGLHVACTEFFQSIVDGGIS